MPADGVRSCSLDVSSSTSGSWRSTRLQEPASPAGSIFFVRGFALTYINDEFTIDRFRKIWRLWHMLLRLVGHLRFCALCFCIYFVFLVAFASVLFFKVTNNLG